MEKIINTFGELCLPFKDRIGGPKLDKLTELLVGLTAEYEPGIGVIVNRQEAPKKIIVSHIDLIKKFQKGFLENQTFEVLEGKVIGALDNTITNAVLVNIILELKEEDLLEGIEFLFSEGEEVGMIGMSNYLKEYRDKLSETFFINLDVTNEGYSEKCDIAIEYDKPNFEVIKNLQSFLVNAHYTGDRVCDDTDAIVRAGFNGFSACIPTDKTIHSYKNKCRLKSVEMYFNSLKAIILDEFDYSNRSSNISDNQVENCATCESIEDLPVIKKRDWTSYWDSYDKKYEPGYNPWDDKKDSFYEDDWFGGYNPLDNDLTIDYSFDKLSNFVSNLTSFNLLSLKQKADFMNLIEIAFIMKKFNFKGDIGKYIIKSDIVKLQSFLFQEYSFCSLNDVFFIDNELDFDFMYSEFYLNLSELKTLRGDMKEIFSDFGLFVSNFFSNKFTDGESILEEDEMDLFKIFPKGKSLIEEMVKNSLIIVHNKDNYEINFEEKLLTY